LVKQIPHTSDLGIFISSKTLDGLFKDAVKGFLILVGRVSREKANTKKKKLKIEGQSTEEILVSLLNELISLFYFKRLYPEKIESIKIQQNKISSEILFSKIKDFSNIREIKSATFHNLKIEKNRFFKTTVFFDV